LLTRAARYSCEVRVRRRGISLGSPSLVAVAAGPSTSPRSRSRSRRRFGSIPARRSLHTTERHACPRPHVAPHGYAEIASKLRSSVPSPRTVPAVAGAQFVCCTGDSTPNRRPKQDRELSSMKRALGATRDAPRGRANPRARERTPDAAPLVPVGRRGARKERARFKEGGTGLRWQIGAAGLRSP
jgi:hypothetical protein